MLKPLLPGLAFFLASVSLAGQDKQPPTPQIQRGHDLFVKSPKGLACATCHRMGGEGTAIGPDLTTMGSMGTPHVIVMTMRMTMTNYVQSFKTTGRTFPGMLKEKLADGSSAIWDLSTMPPELRTVPAKDLIKADRDQTWKHPPASVDYTPQELADLVGFLHWAAAGSQKEVRAEECDMQ